MQSNGIAIKTDELSMNLEEMKVKTDETAIEIDEVEIKIDHQKFLFLVMVEGSLNIMVKIYLLPRII